MKFIKLFENFLNEGKTAKEYKKPTSKQIDELYDAIDNRDGNYTKNFPDIDPKVIKIVIDCWENRAESKIKTEINKYYQYKK